MSIAEGKLREVEDGLKQMLDQAFEGRVTFDPIKVEATSDHYGEDNLNIIVVYDGGCDRLDPDKLNMVSLELASVLTSWGFRNMPTESYIERDEYQDWIALTNQSPWEPDES